MKKSILLPVILIFVGVAAAGQTAYQDSLFHRAHELRKGYHFNEAISLYKQIVSDSTDSLLNTTINTLIAESENGLNMLQYATRPVVTGKASIPRKDFFLYYPEATNWAPIPDSLSKDTTKYHTVNTMLVREGHNSHYFSALNEDGNWDIYRISHLDSNKWTYPEKLGDYVNSHGDELFPMVTSDGSQLFFSSNGHFGIGGFDLYVSNWNEATEEWSLPQNLGFPYSSVDNDLLLIHSQDGKHTYFVSDRSSHSADSLILYRLQFENTPIRRAVSSIQEARELAQLTITEVSPTLPSRGKRDVMTTPETEEYTKMVMEVKRIQTSIDSTEKEIAKKRNLYSSLEDAQKKAGLEKEISDSELRMLDMQSLLRNANEIAQKREMEFLSKGTLMPRREDFFQPDIIEEYSVETKEFSPVRKALSQFPRIDIMPPVQLFDYTFRVEDESVMAEDQSIPDGIVYRLQLFALTSKNKNLNLYKGLSPIFEGRNSAGRWIYYAGQFYKYEEATNALSTAKRSGFPGAIIAAFKNGRSISVRNARIAEQEEITVSNYQVVIAGYPAGMPDPVLDLIRENTSRDIARQIEGGKNFYYVGPFESKQEAEQIVTLLENIGAEKISLKELE